MEYITLWTHKKRTSGKEGTDFVVIKQIGKIDVKTEKGLGMRWKMIQKLQKTQWQITIIQSVSQKVDNEVTCTNTLSRRKYMQEKVSLI